MATPIFDNIFEAEDSFGRPVVSGKVYTYEPGTTTPKVTYSDEAGTIPNTNPVILNSSGKAQIYGNGEYTINVLDLFSGQVPGFPKNIWSEVTGADIVKIPLVFDNIDALRATPGGFQNQAAIVLGYDTPGDGGGGPKRRWNIGAGQIDNGGSIIVPGGIIGSVSTVGAWIFPEVGIIPIEFFGAKVDSITDDSVAILATMAVTKTPSINSGVAFINADITIPYGTEFHFYNGAVFDVNTGKTLAISGELPQKNIKIFTLRSNIIFSDGIGVSAYPAWFGCSPNATPEVNKEAIQKTLDSVYRGARIQLPQGQINSNTGITFKKTGLSLYGTSNAASWTGTTTGGTAIYFSSDNPTVEGFIMTGTQFDVGVGNSDGSGIYDMEIRSATKDAITTGIDFRGPKFFRNIKVLYFSNLGIYCSEWGIGFDMFNVDVRDIGQFTTGRGILIEGVNSTTYTIRNSNIHNCYKGIEIKAGIDFKIENVIIEGSKSYGLHVHNEDGTSLVGGQFNQVWAEENNSGSISSFAVRLGTEATIATWYPEGLTFNGCRMAPVQVGQRSILVDPNVGGTLLNRCRLGGTAIDNAQFDSFVKITNPVGGYTVGVTSIYTEVPSYGSGAINRSSLGQEVSSSGSLPKQWAMANGTTMTISFKAGSNASGIVMVGDAGTGANAIGNFGISAIAIISDPGGILEASGSPAIGKFGFYKPTQDTLAIVNNVGSTRNVIFQVIGPEIVSVSNPI